jgi:alpha-L-fucosidase
MRLGTPLVVALLGSLALTTTGAARRAAPVPCRAARYVVDAVSKAGAVQAGTAIDVGDHVAVGAACARTPPRSVRAKRKRGVTVVKTRWDACDGLSGRVRLKAKLVDECTGLVGTLKAKRVRQRLEASRTECGDGVLDGVAPPEPYAATAESLATHPLPRWWADAKFGVMIHWGMFAVPAWAETVLDPAEWLASFDRLLEPPDYGREWFTHIPYTEWYANTIQIDGSPAQQHHLATWGADFAYEDFRPLFDEAAAAWSAEVWADLFAEAGARYVVLVTKHHDGYALWPSEVPHPVRAGWHTERDVVGELSAAVRRRCMRMGLYYSGGFDWSVQPGPMENALDLALLTPMGPAYVAYVNAHWRELIARYRPAVMWNDVGYPADPGILSLFADYYNAVPDGVINDRFTIVPALTRHDYRTTEFAVPDDVSPVPFETVRGMGRGFGWNRNETDADLDSADELIHLLIDVTSKNGRLLLNVGPRADGSIPEGQVARLRAIGAWLTVNGEAVHGTRPWVRAIGTTGAGTPVRFTANVQSDTVYVVVLGALDAGPLVIEDVPGTPAAVRLLGSSATPTWSRDGGDLRVSLPETPAPQAAHALALDGFRPDALPASRQD